MSPSDTLYTALAHDHETLAWATSVSSQKLIAAIHIGRWAIEKVVDLGVTDEDTAAIITQAKATAKLEADEAAQVIVHELEQLMKKTVFEKDVELREKVLELESLQRHMADKDAKLRDMDTALKNIVKEFCEGELKDLRRQLQERETEIKTLRNTNAAKCVIGESLIMDTLRTIYTRSEISHTGKQAHECDIHMKDLDDHIMIFESKYKNAITKTDVDKFYYDIANQPDDRTVIGAVFISLNTPNIPTKGDLTLEFSGGTIPTLFLGFKNPDDFSNNFPAVITLFTRLCKHHLQHIQKQKELDANANSCDDAKQEKLDQVAAHIETTFVTLTTNNNKIADLRKLAGDLEENNKVIINNLTLMASIIDPTATQAPRNNPLQQVQRATTTTKNLYKCEKCNTATFTNKKEFAKHTRSCNN